MHSFNLVEKPWIPCMFQSDASVREVGLRDILVFSHNVREIVDSSPLVTAALHRLLLAILHRNFGPPDVHHWQEMWRRNAWNKEVLDAYFQRWWDHFDLFSETHPFYQTPSLDFSREGTWARLELHADNNPTLFSHLVSHDPPPLTPGEAARLLVAYQAFDTGGLKTAERGQESAKAAPLTKGAVILAKGLTLFRTLMLNMHRLSPGDEEPFPSEPNDLPAWEWEGETPSGGRRPRGYLDLLTWQSRRIRLHPMAGPDGDTVVRNVVIMKGAQLPDDWFAHGREPMLAFKRRLKAQKGQDPWPAITFQERRALWRDSLALMQLPGNEAWSRPKTLTWLADLVADGFLQRSLTVPLDVLGLSCDRAKVFFWRHERLPLPLAYLEDSDAGRSLLEKLREALDLAENVGRTLNRHMWTLARRILIPDWDQEKDKRLDKLARRRVDDLSSSLGADRAYWSKLETPFKRLLVDLPEDTRSTLDSDQEFGAITLPAWVQEIRRAAWAAFREATGGLERSARTLRALAQVERAFNSNLYTILGPYQQNTG